MWRPRGRECLSEGKWKPSVKPPERVFALPDDRRALRAAACVLVIFVIRLALALGSVPPWQNPDEPQHVMAVWFAGGHDPSPDAVARMEGAVIESMARHRWWELVGESTPSPLPVRFADDEALEERWIAMPRSDGLYYAVASAVCAAPSPEDTLEAARRLSAAAGLGVVVLAMAIGRSLLASWTGVGVGAVLALHPQFLVVATTASADAFIALLSTGAIGRPSRRCRRHALCSGSLRPP